MVSSTLTEMRIPVIESVEQATYRTHQGFRTFVTVPGKHQCSSLVPFPASPASPTALVQKSLEHFEFTIVLF
jgi:hypothetical protein